MTCLCKCPPAIDILEELKPNTGFMNFINIGMLCSLVLRWDGVLNLTAGLKESEGHIYIYQEETS